MENKKDYTALLRVGVVILVVALFVGLMVAIVGKASDDIGGIVGGGTTGTTATTATTATTSDDQKECEHTFTDGTCSKCEYVCGHSTSDMAANGNKYCSACGKLMMLKTPAPSYANSKITWDPVDDAIVYIVYVNGAQNTTINTYYDLYVPEAGDYVIQIKAYNGKIYSELSEKLTLHYYTFSVDENDNGDIMGVGNWEDETPLVPVIHGGSWSGQIYPHVGHVLPSKVYITMNGGLMTSGFTYNSETGVITIDKVTGNFYITYDAPKERPAAPVASIAGNTVSWDGVTGADGYAVNVYGNGFDTWYKITETSFAINMLEIVGDYTVDVWSEKGGLRSETCSSVTFHFTDGYLTTPVLTKSGNIASWTLVEGAKSYLIIADNASGQSVYIASGLTVTSVDLADYEDRFKLLGAGSYTVYVRAIGENVTSKDSNAVSYTLTNTSLAAPVITEEIGAYGAVSISWERVPGADRYDIYCQGSTGRGGIVTVEAGSVNTTEYFVTISNYASRMEQYGAGPYQITVVAKGSGFTDSPASNVISYSFSKLATPEIELVGDELFWAAVPNAIGYAVYATSSDGEWGLIGEPITGTRFDLSEHRDELRDLGDGPYDMQVIAYASGAPYANSNYSNKVEYAFTESYDPVTIELINRGTSSNPDYYIEFDEPDYDVDRYSLVFIDQSNSSILWSCRLTPENDGRIAAHLTGVNIMSMANFTNGDVVSYVTTYYTVNGVEYENESNEISYNLNTIGAIARVVGVMDDDYAITLNDSLTNGVYTLKYEDDQGVMVGYSNICSLEVSDSSNDVYNGFIKENCAPMGAVEIGVYNSRNERVGFIPFASGFVIDAGEKLYSQASISDVHVPYSTAASDLQKALTYFNTIDDLLFVNICGDLTSVGSAEEFADYVAIRDTYSTKPVYAVSGNHDATPGLTFDSSDWTTYTGHNLWYTYTEGDDLYIMVGVKNYSSATPFSTEELQWLYETLEENRNKRVFLYQHVFAWDGSGDGADVYTFNMLDNVQGQVFLSLLKHYKNVVWFHGHSHQDFDTQEDYAINNIDTIYGRYSVHIPSLAVPKDVVGDAANMIYEKSEGYIVDVYEQGIILRGRDFVNEEYLPIAIFYLDTTLQTIPAEGYHDPTGTIIVGTNAGTSPYTNLVPTAKGTDGTVLNGVGYLRDARWSSTDGSLKTAVTGCTAIGCISITEGEPLTIYVYGLELDGTSNSALVTTSGLGKGVKKFSNTLKDGFTGTTFVTSVEKLGNYYYKITTLATNSGTNYFELCGVTVDGVEPIVTMNEPIIDENPSYTNILTSGTYTVRLNERYSASSGGYKGCNGMIVLEIPLDDVLNKTIRMKGFENGLESNGSGPCWYILDGMTRVGLCVVPGGTGNIWLSESLITDSNGVSSILVNSSTFSPITGTALVINLALGDNIISEADLVGKIITIDEPIV